MTREPIEIGNVQALPGTRVEGGIPVGQRLDGTPDQIPIIVLHGAGPGPVLWLNGGTHGDEPEGAFSIHLALAALDPAAMRGTLVAVPAMNVPAFQAGERENNHILSNSPFILPSFR